MGTRTFKESSYHKMCDSIATWIFAIVESIAEIFVREYCDALLLIPA